MSVFLFMLNKVDVDNLLLSLDPSYSSTGVVVYNGTDFVHKSVIKPGIKVQSSLLGVHNSTMFITDYIENLLNTLNIKTVIYEYPVMQSLSGSLLMSLHGSLFSLFRKYRLTSVYVPPSCCNSFVKNKTKTKTFLVNYCKSKGYITKKTSHDICTAMIFCEVYNSILNNKYKNSYFVDKF